jgi:hypothetical protein
MAAADGGGHLRGVRDLLVCSQVLAGTSPRYLHPAATAGAGEAVALVALALAGVGILVGLVTE